MVCVLAHHWERRELVSKLICLVHSIVVFASELCSRKAPAFAQSIVQAGHALFQRRGTFIGDVKISSQKGRSRQVMRRLALTAILTLSLVGGSLITASSASAKAAHTAQAHTQLKGAIPSSLTDHTIYLAATGVLVTGTLHFTGRQSFQLLNMVLSDTLCDARSVYFTSGDQIGHYAQHSNSFGCGSSVHYPTLYGSADHTINWIMISDWTYNDSTGYGDSNTTPEYANPYVS
jgi:hypothetical protein